MSVQELQLAIDKLAILPSPNLIHVGYSFFFF